MCVYVLGGGSGRVERWLNLGVLRPGLLDLLSVPRQLCVLSYLIYDSRDGDGGDGW